MKSYISPTETPISQHIKTFVAKDGIAPQIDVAMNKIVDNKIEYRLPTLSARTPHTTDPITVADIAIVGNIAPCVLVNLYSCKSPLKKSQIK